MSITSVVFVVFGLLCSTAAYFIAAAAHGRLMDIVTVFFQYCAFLPTLINAFTIYSLCNTHDISWGTKEGNVSTLTMKSAETKAAKARRRAAATAAKLEALQRG